MAKPTGKIRFACPDCGAYFSVPTKWLGRKFRCTRCKFYGRVPSPGAQAKPNVPRPDGAQPDIDEDIPLLQPIDDDEAADLETLDEADTNGIDEEYEEESSGSARGIVIVLILILILILVLFLWARPWQRGDDTPQPDPGLEETTDANQP
jgi:hypothetical protein